MSFSDPTPLNLMAAAVAFKSTYDAESPYQHHIEVLLQGAAIEITTLNKRNAEQAEEIERRKKAWDDNFWLNNKTITALQARITKLEAAHKANARQDTRTNYAEKGHRCDWRAAYEAVQARSKGVLAPPTAQGEQL